MNCNPVQASYIQNYGLQNKDKTIVEETGWQIPVEDVDAAAR